MHFGSGFPASSTAFISVSCALRRGDRRLSTPAPPNARWITALPSMRATCGTFPVFAPTIAAYEAVLVREPMAKDGVLPFDTASDAVSAPDASRLPTPLDAVPTPKCVTTDVPAVHAGKVTAAALDAVSAVHVKPLDVRATATRAYPV